jgi:hypothetical protein
MKAAEMHAYISGPHSDYYLLLDEQADHIFAMRLAEHVREARGSFNCVGVMSGVVEIWIDDSSKQVWYVFDPKEGRS